MSVDEATNYGGVRLPHATDVLWYPNLFRGLPLVGDNSPEFPSAKLRMCGVDVDRRSSPGILLLEWRRFLDDWC